MLGIETSCDETAAAIVDMAAPPGERILASRILSQHAAHRPHGGIVPEIAARAHLDHTDRLVAEAMAEAGATFTDLAGVAATAGPGLVGGLIVGLMTGKAVALAHDLPFAAVNHLEAHGLTARLTDDVAFPYLLLLVSGGHTQFLAVEGVGRHHQLGTTLDDAAGEAFDKAAALLNLGWPGGPAIEQAARRGNATRFPLPRPLAGRPGADLSFSGLKTALRQTVEGLDPLSAASVADLAAAMQAAIVGHLAARAGHAVALFRERHGPGRPLVAAGGVAANSALAAALGQVAETGGMTMLRLPPALCTDNAAMVAWAGGERLAMGLCDGLDAAPRPRWPLDHSAASPRPPRQTIPGGGNTA
ncbi:MAG: tRNA (adenosine(37)-N6)-threonylcarbamoyltransferase complex transferase subunit TsaD [Alphaproteobacteria bacterium]